jgi:hypothetical protein
MPEQTFIDSQKQLIVRLSEDALIYAPAGQKGWQCRPSDIAWTSSRITSRGIQEVNLHGANGRVAVTILEFEQIERFYVALLQILLRRPVFDPVRADLPAQVGLQERALWLAAQAGPEDAPWEALRITEQAAVLATPAWLLLCPTPERCLEPIRWRDLAGVRCREARCRFYGEGSAVEVPISGLEEAIVPVCERHMELLRAERIPRPIYEIAGVLCDDDDLAMTYSWEIERARDEGVFEAGERVVACVTGVARGVLAPGAATDAGAPLFGAVDPLRAVGSVLDRTQFRTELILTDRRLIHIERNFEDATDSTVAECGHERISRLQRTGATLFVGTFELRCRSEAAAADFLRRLFRYRKAVVDRSDPFSTELEAQVPVHPGSDGDSQERLREAEALHRMGFLSDEELETARGELTSQA